MYKRMQGNPKKNQSLEEADALAQEYFRTGIIGGGCKVGDNDVLDKLSAIQNGNYTRDEKLDLLEGLTWYTTNRHEFGNSSEVYQTVRDAYNEELEKVPYWAR